jgi:serine protease Do
MHRTHRSAFVLLVGCVVPCLAALALPLQPVRPEASTPAKDGQAEADLNVARSLSRAFNRAAASVEPSVVHITQMRDVNIRRGFEVESRPMAVGAGSGVIVSGDGYIITNNHVIEGATGVSVKLADGNEVAGRVVGMDPATDLGVVKIDVPNLPAAQWGDDDALSVGEWVLAIGSPFGQFDNTVTAGIISAKNRTGLAGPRDERFEDFIQTDAAINPGNSGGPLVNLEGKIVGINSQIATRSGGNVGIGFSIPASIARPVMEMIIKNNGRVERGWIGIGMADDLVPVNNGKRGVALARVVPGGPASKAGLKPNDVLTRFNGRDIDSVNRLRNAIAFTAPGTDASVEFVRNGDPVTATIRIVDTTQGRAIIPGGRAIARYGFTVDTLPANSIRRLTEESVIVNYVSRLSPASEDGLQVEDIILRANGTAVDNAEQFDNVIKDNRAARLRLDVYRPSTGQRGYITIDTDDRARPAD